jgi:hypothetical protein
MIKKKLKDQSEKIIIPIISTKLELVTKEKLEEVGTYIEEIVYGMGIRAKGKINRQLFSAQFPSSFSPLPRPLYLSLNLPSHNIHYLELFAHNKNEKEESNIEAIKFAIGYQNRKPTKKIDKDRLHNLLEIGARSNAGLGAITNTKWKYIIDTDKRVNKEDYNKLHAIATILKPIILGYFHHLRANYDRIGELAKDDSLEGIILPK